MVQIFVQSLDSLMWEKSETCLWCSKIVIKENEICYSLCLYLLLSAKHRIFYWKSNCTFFMQHHMYASNIRGREKISRSCPLLVSVSFLEWMKEWGRLGELFSLTLHILQCLLLAEYSAQPTVWILFSFRRQ